MSQLELLPKPLTCKQIQHALFEAYHKGGSVVVPNCCALTHEADVLVLRKTGYVAEYEVKVSRADFKADFRKLSKHDFLKAGHQWCANEFWFACEEGLIQLDEVPEYAGLIYIVQHRYQYPGSDTWYCKNVAVVQKKAPRIHKTIHKNLVHKLAISLMYKAFT
ncbi:hypothetical protein [Hymenobacter pini]|uniref:hypothetical protein n=1 Tax=Hymenobacter pini TaxID=2880879 RepID=UPI001CF4847E|nr:hypothetical protein [Hymenobacter pini]MCA8829413.1 hypothetical protein [Hymenobacter pini]